MKRILVAMVLLVGCESRAKPPEPVASPRASRLTTSLASIASASDGTVAVTVLDLATGERAAVNGDVRLPMMSVFKLPLAIVALSRVDDGTYRLDQPVAIAESELRPGVSPIAEAWKAGEHTVSMELLLRRMLQDSDNTAGDKLVAMLGAPAATARLRALGMTRVEIAEQEIEIFARLRCPSVAAPKDGWTFPAIDACPAPAVGARLAAAEREIVTSPNGSTTNALVDMLAVLERGAALSAASRAWLRDTLAGTKTGRARLPAGVPAGTRVEHKTGTGDTIDGLNIATNDVGVIVLPDGKRIAIAALSAGSRRDGEARERTLAELARATWAHFAR